MMTKSKTKTDKTTEMTEAIESDNMIETCDDRPGHRMMADDHVIDLCDFSSTTISEDRVQRRVCQDHISGAFNANDEDGVSSKRDMDAEKSSEKVNENDAVPPKCDEDAAKSAVDEDTNVAAASRKRMQIDKAAAAKTYLKKMMKSQVKMKKLRRLVEERRNTICAKMITEMRGADLIVFRIY